MQNTIKTIENKIDFIKDYALRKFKKQRRKKKWKKWKQYQ